MKEAIFAALPLLMLLPAAHGESLQNTNSSAAHAMAGTAPASAFIFTAQGGYPWQRLRGARGLNDDWTTFVEAESALIKRSQFSLGVTRTWLDVGTFTLGGEAQLGYFLQTDDLAQRGPTAALRMRFSRQSGRLLPYLMLGSRHVLLITHTLLHSAEGVESSYSAEHKWTPEGVFGAAFAINDTLGLDVGIDWPYIDASQLTIPGVHLGVHVRR